jgi:hypothetical protein
MVTPPDPFVLHVDIIDVDPKRAASPIGRARPASIDRGQPGFYITDDAGGRFVVDREFGVVSLRDETLLAAERGQVHSVRLRVVESSGEDYELEMRLRVTGMVPHMVGAEEFGFGADHPAPAPRAPCRPWSAFAAACGLQTRPPLPAIGAYGALLTVSLPPTSERIAIAFGERFPISLPAHAIWSL